MSACTKYGVKRSITKQGLDGVKVESNCVQMGFDHSLARESNYNIPNNPLLYPALGPGQAMPIEN